ncbi:DUF4365 domain-containing protein [Pseudonocardia sp.]|uniref:DUF4365 domain-containing protein n=1 Tax=Pseudonocardia sp. TaxID=60912 RepID=UPI0026096041|nr:DUF4365 domain-containing protein [Pseudonocardia sp.]
MPPPASFPAVHSAGIAYGTLQDNECRQQWSIANVQAVVTAARCALENIRIDYEGVDAVIRQSADHDLYDSLAIDVQLKCTSQISNIADDHIKWRLSKKHYDKLSSVRHYNPRILVVCTAPLDFTTWLNVSDDELLLKGCGYWQNLHGWPAFDGDSKTIEVPRSNQFNVEQLLGMLHRVGSGGRP